MNSIIDQQQELQYDGIVLDREWVENRIANQFTYVAEIWQSKRTRERKLELTQSAFGVVHNFLSVYPDWQMAIFVTCLLSSLRSVMMTPTPKPSFTNGGYAVALEMGYVDFRRGIMDVKLNMFKDEKINSLSAQVFMEHS